MKPTIINCVTVLLLLSSVTVVFTQKKSVKAVRPKEKVIDIYEAPSPPPPPRVAVIDARLKEFVSEDGGFKIKLPGTPRKSVSAVDTAVGQITLNQYSAIGNAASYLVSYTDYPAPVTDQLELKIRYDNGRDNIIKSAAGSALVDEKDVYFGDHFGRELVVEKVDVTSTYRIFLIQQRLFQMVVITPRLSKAPESIQNSYKETIENFFNSFVIVKIPPPPPPAPPLPENFGLNLQGSDFSSKYLDLSLTLPQNWNKLTSEELEFWGKTGSALTAKKGQGLKDQFDLSVKNSKDLLTLTKLPFGAEGNASLKIVVERVNFIGFVPRKLLQYSTETLYVGKFGLQTIKPVENVRIDGVDFAHVGLINPLNGTKLQLYLANRKNIALELAFSYVNDEDLATFEKLLQSLKLK